MGSNMDMEQTIENYFGDVVGKGPFVAGKYELDSLSNRYDHESLDEFLGVDEDLDGVVFTSEEGEAAYVSRIDNRGTDIYMTLNEINDEDELLHGLARSFVDYGEPELGDWEDSSYL